MGKAAAPEAGDSGVPATAKVPDDAEVLMPGQHVRSVEVDGEAVLYDERSGTLHHLNASASVIWWRLDGVATIGQVIDEFAASFRIARATMKDDVGGAMLTLIEHGLVAGAPRRRPTGRASQAG